MQITGMLWGRKLLDLVEFTHSEVHGPELSVDEIKDMIKRHGQVFIKPVFKGGVGKKGKSGLLGRVDNITDALKQIENINKFILDDKKFPLVLFSHGNGGLATQNLSQIEELVSNGYIVVACNHTYNASITFTIDGDPVLFQRNVTWDEQAAYHRKYYTGELIEYRYQDLAFILDELNKEKSQEGMTNQYRDLINFNAVGVMGHSMGGGSSYYALLNDNRIKAALALDGWFFALNEEDATINIKKPFMHIGQEEFFDTSVMGDMNKSEDGKENLKIYNLILENNKPSYAVYIKNSLHYTFTDLKQVYVAGSPLAIPLPYLGKVDKAVVKNTINESMIEFFGSTLKNQKFQKNIYNKDNKEVIFISNENQ